MGGQRWDKDRNLHADANETVHGSRGQCMDGSNWLKIETGFAGTAVEDRESVFLYVLESNTTKSSLH